MGWFSRRPATDADSIDQFAESFGQLVRNAEAPGLNLKDVFRKTIWGMTKAGMSRVDIIDVVEGWMEDVRPRDGGSVLANLVTKYGAPRRNSLQQIQAELDTRPRPRRQPGPQPNPQALRCCAHQAEPAHHLHYQFSLTRNFTNVLDYHLAT
jgi:hypothetical protein